MSKKFAAFVVLLWPLLLASQVSASTQQTAALPQPTGPYKVGRTSFHWVDAERAESRTDDPNDRRELMVHIWYPAEVPANPTTAPYCINFDIVKAALPSYQKKFCQTITTYSYADAKFATGLATRPVLIFSHGNEMVAGLYSFLLEEMASHGYIVAAIDHPYEAQVVGYPDGRVAKYIERDFNPKKFASVEESYQAFEQYNRQRIEGRALDASFVLNQLEKVQTGQIKSELKDHLALTKVGIFGHSNGGAAAAWALRDKRFKAALNLDGHMLRFPFYLDDKGNGPQGPFMYLDKYMPPFPEPTDEELAKKYKTTRQEFEENKAKGSKKRAEIYDAMRAAGYYHVTLKGAVHNSFADSPMILALDDSKKRALTQHHAQIIRAYVLAFFELQLQGKPSDLLSGKAAPYSEVSVEILKQ